jgi:hypothetical protein
MYIWRRRQIFACFMDLYRIKKVKKKYLLGLAVDLYNRF